MSNRRMAAENVITGEIRNQNGGSGHYECMPTETQRDPRLWGAGQVPSRDGEPANAFGYALGFWLATPIAVAIGGSTLVFFAGGRHGPVWAASVLLAAALGPLIGIFFACRAGRVFRRLLPALVFAVGNVVALALGLAAHGG
ncbi:MAG: hypothetical protein AAF721_05495 [Myxococcota bacterium]